MKWSMPTNASKVRSFNGAAQYIREFIASLAVVASLHAITTSSKSFQWGKGQQKALVKHQFWHYQTSNSPLKWRQM